jgi:formiminotetrahydrofolate cyclodeaminase
MEDGGDAAAGPVAAHVAAAAARLLGAAADAAGLGAEAAQARALGRRLKELAVEDAAALEAARAALSAPADDRKPASRDFTLGRRLDWAASVPLAIAEASADVVDLAGAIEERVRPDAAADVRAAAHLAAGAAQAAAELVATNLGVAPDDERLLRARRAAGSL